MGINQYQRVFVQSLVFQTTARCVGVALMTLIYGLPAGYAQSVCLPAPRLLTLMPMGGQCDSEVEVVISGQHLEQAGLLRFSTPAITASAKRDADGAVIPNHYLVRIDEDCPPGVYEARVLTGLGISSPRAFCVGTLPESIQQQPNTSLDRAMSLELNSICNAATTAKSIDYYRFEARRGQRVLIDCAAKGIDSKLDPVLIIADGEGRDLTVERRGGAIDFSVPAEGNYTIKVHELTFKGGPEFFYRLALQEIAADATAARLPATQSVSSFSWPPFGLSPTAASSEKSEQRDEQRTEVAERIELPCDIAGSFYPAADVDIYEFEARKGEIWWIEVASERLGRPTDPSLLVQRVVASVDDETTESEEILVDVAELSDIASPVKVSSNGYSYDGPPYNAGSTDILGRVEIEHDGLYRLRLTDLFGGTRNDPANRYRLIIRRAQPDFALVAWALHMNLRNGDRNALSKPLALRPGTTMPLEVVVVRRDGFDGAIELAMEGLPDGVTATGLTIAAGQSRGIMLLTADEGAPAGLADADFFGQAMIDGERVRRPCRLATVAWPVPNSWSEIPAPRLVADIPVSVCESEPSPLTIAPKQQKVWEVSTGGKLTIPLLHMRRSEFSGSTMSLKCFGSGFEAMPPVDIPLNQDASEVSLDLAKLKPPPGEYRIAFYGSAVAKRGDKDIVDIFVSQPIVVKVKPGNAH